MLILWDEPKRETNLRIHGIDFADVRDGFDFSAADITASHAGRFKATGVLGARLATVVFSLVGTEALSIVSARPASRKERKAHETRSAEDPPTNHR